MNTLKLSLLFMGLSLLGPGLQAAPFDHPCEVLYWKVNREEDPAERDLLKRRFSTCVDQFGETDLIKEAKDYLRETNDYAADVQAKIDEQLEIAKGERAGKVVQELDEDEILNHENNPLGAPLVSRSTIFSGRKSPKEYETKADAVCKYLGYDRSTGHTESRQFDNGSRKDRSEMPEEVLELRRKGFFGGFQQEPIVHRAADHNSLDYGIAFRYYTSLTCEREVLEGETLQNFEVDIDEVTRAVRSQMEPPKLDDEVARILSLNRSSSDANEIGEDREENIERRYGPKEWDSNPFIYTPRTIRQ